MKLRNGQKLLMTWALRNVFCLAVLGLTTTAMIWLWYEWPEVLVTGFDLNLTAIKWLAAGLPEAWAFQFEAALRGLSLERAFLFGQVWFAVWLVLTGICRLFFVRKR